MSDVFVDELGMQKLDHFVIFHGGRLGSMTGRLFDELECVLLEVEGRAKETGMLKGMSLELGGYMLSTVHHAENTDNAARLAAIGDAQEATAENLHMFCPLQARTRAVLLQMDRLDQRGIGYAGENVAPQVNARAEFSFNEKLIVLS